MKYNLADQKELDQAFEYLSSLAGREVVAEVKELRPQRSGQQNRYLHVILGAFGMHFGYTIDEAKTIYKREANPDIYVYEKNGTKFLRSSADLDKSEMTISIDRFRDYAKEHDLYLPPPENEAELRSLENAIERNNYYISQRSTT